MQLPRSLLLWLLLILPVTYATAQFNDSVTHYINFSTTGIINKTNETRSFLLSNILKFNVKKKKVSLNSTNSFIYGHQEERITNRDISASLDFNIYPRSRKFYYWGLVNFDKSYSLKIDYRIQNGLGVAYRFFDTDNIALNISDGILYEKSNLKLTDTTNKKYETFRNSFRLRYKFVIREIFILNGTNLFQNSLSDGDDYIIQSVNSLSIKLRKWLSLTTAVTYNKVTRNDRENLLLTFGLTAEKYF